MGLLRLDRRSLQCAVDLESRWLLRRSSVARPATQPHASASQRYSSLVRGGPCPVRRAGTCLPGAKEARHLGERKLSQSVLREWAPPPLTLHHTVVFAHHLSSICALSCHRRCCLAPASALSCVIDIHLAVTRSPHRLQEAWALAYKKHASIASSCWNAISSAVQLRRRWL